MSGLQIAAIAVTIALNALDGFDILSISFASPGISQEWGIDRVALGAVLAMELIGMAIGSLVLGNLADRIGRRPTVIGCLLVMSVGMLGVTTAGNIITLSAWRVLMGLGIGGMLAGTNAMAAEFSNARRRGLAMALMVIGYPIGAVIGGSVAALLLKGGDWRAVFEFGALATIALLPLVWFFLPETVQFLAVRRSAGALDRINATLARMRHPIIEALPLQTVAPARGSYAGLFAPEMMANTIIVTIAYFAHIATFYFILKWVPKIVVDMGFAPSSAAGVLVWANVGGALGGAAFGLLTQRVPLKPLTIAGLLASFAFVCWFGRGQANLQQLALAAGMAGFFTNAGMVGLYSICAQTFPTHLRASGTGFAIGMGRGGAALSPVLAGFLFDRGLGLQLVAAMLAAGSLLAAGALLFLRLSERIAVGNGYEEIDAR